jgi:hypothetical protein
MSSETFLASFDSAFSTTHVGKNTVRSKRSFGIDQSVRAESLTTLAICHKTQNEQKGFGTVDLHH